MSLISLGPIYLNATGKGLSDNERRDWWDITTVAN